MEPQVQLLSKPDFDIDKFIAISQKALGYHLLAPVDKLPREATHFEKFITTLSCFHDEDSTGRPVREILLNSASLCAHLSFSFMFAGSYELIFKSMERTNLHHTTATQGRGLHLSVVSGTLTEWRQALLECCQPSSDWELRKVYEKVLYEFQSMKINWPDIKQSKHKDGSLLLESK